VLIKILFVFHVSEIGGGSFCLLNILKRIDRNQYEPVVLLKCKGPLSDELELLNVRVVIEKSISTVPYNVSIFSLGSIIQIVSLCYSKLKFNHWLKVIRPDILHLNSMMLYPYMINTRKYNIKTIVHMREHWPKDEHRFQFRAAKSIINKHVDKIIAINETSANIIGLTKKTSIIYDWIDFSNRNKKIDLLKTIKVNSERELIFLFLGGMQSIKGAYEIVKTFSNKIDDDNARLIFVGYNSEEYDSNSVKAYIKTILRRINKPVYSDRIKNIVQKDDRIIFIPATKNVKNLIEQAYCLVSFPIIPHAILPLAESIWNCTPVISADTPEAREYTNDGKGAILVPMNNLEELAKAMKYAINNPEQIRTNAYNGSKRIRTMFDPEVNYGKLSELYSSLSSKQ
jgi:glycosyltransferase involved in cell wall biosynthesis